ncbi:MAG: M1 family metallopeptidase [Bacteroidota bacterium]|nr:M1 family metallopeptidase [Bacteroidota bacterium]
MEYTRQDTLRGALNVARLYGVHYYDLSVTVDIEGNSLLGVNTIHFTTPIEMDSIQVDLFDRFNILSVKQGENQLNYREEGNHIFVYLPEKSRTGKSYTIQISYEGKPQEALKPPWDGGFTWTKDSLGNDWVAVSCQGLGASSWWPCKDHLSDEPDSMRIRFTVPRSLTCISNGQFRGSKTKDSSTEYEWFVSYPINTYNVTLNIGKYDILTDSFESNSSEKLRINYYVFPYHKDRAAIYFQEEVTLMLQCMEKYFGPYPFPRDGYALVETPYWGMEHQSAIAYGNNFNKNDFGFDFIIIHESGHEWWGNAVSVRDNAELWLHEALTTYSEALYMECRHGADSAQTYLNMQRSKIKCDYPLMGTLDVNYSHEDADIYYKGTWMLHTLRHQIGNDSIWFAILYSFIEDHKYETIASGEFIAHANTVTNSDYTDFFQQYLYITALPVLEYQLSKKGKNTIIRYRWVSEVPDFNMQVLLVSKPGHQYSLAGSTEWTKYKLKKVRPREVKVMMDKMLINAVEL